jgi:uncharacterized protein YaaN involved in tellurite resistance
MQEDIAILPDTLPTSAVEHVKEIARSINFNDPTLTVSYGAKPMNEIASFADDLLGQVRSKDVGPVGDILSNLLTQVKAVDLESFGQEDGILSRLPVIGQLFDKMEHNLARMKTVTEQIDEITAQLDKNMINLLTDIQLLEQFFSDNKIHYEELTKYIEAGKQRLDEARAVELPKMQAEVGEDSLKAQEVRDFIERLNRFERRLHDLQVSRTITIQTAPQIRLIQGNNQTLAEKIQSSVMTTIPIWKNQMVLAITLYRQRNAVELQKKVADTTNEMLLKNAEMLGQSSTETARQVERAVVDIETLREVQKKLISTIEESLKITAEGRAKRQAAEKELDQMEANLRSTLVNIVSAKDQQQIAAPPKA